MIAPLKTPQRLGCPPLAQVPQLIVNPNLPLLLGSTCTVYAHAMQVGARGCRQVMKQTKTTTMKQKKTTMTTMKKKKKSLRTLDVVAARSKKKQSFGFVSLDGSGFPYM